jgi:hypothetical protein
MVAAHEVLVRDSWFGFTGATVMVGVFEVLVLRLQHMFDQN